MEDGLEKEGVRTASQSADAMHGPGFFFYSINFIIILLSRSHWMLYNRYTILSTGTLRLHTRRERTTLLPADLPTHIRRDTEDVARYTHQSYHRFQ